MNIIHSTTGQNDLTIGQCYFNYFLSYSLGIMLEKSGFSLSRCGRCCTFFCAIIFFPLSYKMGGKNYSLHVLQHKIYCNRRVCNRIISFTLNGIPLEILYFPIILM